MMVKMFIELELENLNCIADLTMALGKYWLAPQSTQNRRK
jgi:hypothetical protein